MPGEQRHGVASLVWGPGLGSLCWVSVGLPSPEVGVEWGKPVFAPLALNVACSTSRAGAGLSLVRTESEDGNKSADSGKSL